MLKILHNGGHFLPASLSSPAFHYHFHYTTHCINFKLSFPKIFSCFLAHFLTYLTPVFLGSHLFFSILALSIHPFIMLLKFLSHLSSSLFSCSNILTFPFFMPFTSLNSLSVHFICHKKSLLKFNSPYTLCQHLSSCT